jgi:hypothetical protein
MSNVKISALPSAASITGAELVPVVQSNVTVQATVAKILTSPKITGSPILTSAGGGLITLTPVSTASDFTLTVPAKTSTIDTLARTGNVLQVVSATYSTSVLSTSASYADTGLTATITPTSATSKILVLVSQAGLDNSAANNGVNLKLYRDSTAIVTFAQFDGFGGISFNNTSSVNYVDSPSTTSATIYKTQFARAAGAGTAYVQSNSPTSTITLMEIAG